jgi:hypothetical protein
MGPQNLKFENFETKWHLGIGHVVVHKVYYEGEGDGFFQVWVTMSFVNLCLPLVSLCTKSALALH